MLEAIEELFGTSDLYKLLKISKKNAEDQKKLRSAYLKTALQCHPDKATEDQKEIYTKKFQLLSKIIEILQDDDLRKSYDETGEWPAETETINLSDTNFKMDKTEFIAKFKEFKASFQGSDEERQEIERLYTEGKGNIVYIIDNLYCAEFLTDEDRIKGIIDDLVKRKKLKRIGATPAQEKELKKRKRQAKKEEKEAEEMLEEMGLGNSTASLEQQILARRETAGRSFLDDLEKKYCQPTKASKSKNGKRK
jgi:DnaJ family protein C protein 9